MLFHLTFQHGTILASQSALENTRSMSIAHHDFSHAHSSPGETREVATHALGYRLLLSTTRSLLCLQGIISHWPVKCF